MKVSLEMEVRLNLKKWSPMGTVYKWPELSNDEYDTYIYETEEQDKTLIVHMQNKRNYYRAHFPDVVLNDAEGPKLIRDVLERGLSKLV